MRTLRITAGYLTAILALNLTEQGLGAATASTTSNGLRLDCSLSGGTSWADVEVVCRVSNETMSAVEYSIVTEIAGFVPQLLLANGSSVPMRDKFRQRIPNFDISSGRFTNAWLGSGRSGIFRFKLLDGFQLDDPTGCILRLAWDPGIDRSGRRRTIDKNLVAELTIPNLRTLQGGEMPEAPASATKVVGKSEAREDAKTASVENEAPHGDRRASENTNAQFQFRYPLLAVGLLIVAIILFKTVRTKHASRERE